MKKKSSHYEKNEKNSREREAVEKEYFELNNQAFKKCFSNLLNNYKGKRSKTEK